MAHGMKAETRHTAVVSRVLQLSLLVPRAMEPLPGFTKDYAAAHLSVSGSWSLMNMPLRDMRMRSSCGHATPRGALRPSCPELTWRRARHERQRPPARARAGPARIRYQCACSLTRACRRGVRCTANRLGSAEWGEHSLRLRALAASIYTRPVQPVSVPVQYPARRRLRMCTQFGCMAGAATLAHLVCELGGKLLGRRRGGDARV